MLKNRGEAALRLPPRDRAQVESDMVGAGGTHAAHQRATHLIPGGKISSWKAGHGAVASGIHQHTTFTTHGLGYQETGSPRSMQSSGVELNVFQVFNGGAGLPGQRYALTGCLGGICGVGVKVAAPAGGQHDSPRPNPVQ